MKILVTGANGQLGSELQHLAPKHPQLQFVFTDVSDLDITNEKAVLDFFKKHGFTHCINCAAYTAVDKAETDQELCDLINVTGSAVLAKGCAATGATLFHISTDFVFDGKGYKPLQEDESTSPVNYYGLSKLNGENEVRRLLPQHFIVRTSWLYSSFGGNFVKTMLKLAESRPELNIIADQIGTPTYARDLAEALAYIIESGNAPYGTYHYSNEGVASWYDFASAVFEYAGVNVQVNPIPTEAYPTPATRPHYSVMSKQKIKQQAGLHIPHWRESLKRCLRAMGR